MSYEPIRRLEVENYGCIRKASFALSPLHAFIGPNDSGKSTVLRALRTAAQFAAGYFEGAAGNWAPFDPMFAPTKPGAAITLRFPDDLAYGIRNLDGAYDLHESVLVGSTEVAGGSGARAWNNRGLLQQNDIPEAAKDPVATVRNRITQGTMVRFDPDSLRVPAPLIPESQGIAFADERGAGLASVFDAIMNRDAESFARVQAGVRKLFPSVSKVGLINTSESLKEIAVTLTDGTRVGAKAMSEGLLYYLGFAAVQYVDGSRLFLIEEPENGLHPARISEVMAVLREMSKTSQVVIATHSPLAVNALQAHEVSVLTRDPEQGTQTVLLADTPNYAERSASYLNGELDHREGRTEGNPGARRSFFGCFAHLGWQVPDTFDRADDEIADLFEG